MRKRLILPLLVAFLLLGTGAYADPLGGLADPAAWGRALLLMLAIAVVVEASVVVIEGLAYRFVARLSWGRAFGSSILANILSVVAGLVATPVIAAVTGSLIAAYFGLLVVCLTVETPVVMAISGVLSTNSERGGSPATRVTRRRVIGTVVGANVVTFTLVTLTPTILGSLIHDRPPSGVYSSQNSGNRP